MIVVGTNSFGYPQIRNFSGLPFKDVQFKKVFDLYKLGAYINYKSRGRISPRLVNRFNDYGISKVHLYHFFNTITPVKRAWVVTFETTLPRLDPLFGSGYEWLASKNCRKIIAISNRAFEAQVESLKRFPEYAGDIVPKMEILQPSQRLYADYGEARGKNERIVITFVGSAFYRKGGLELLRAFSSLKKKDNFHLNIVSRLEREGYMDAHVDKDVEEEVKQTIGHHENISHYTSLDNDSVIALFRKSDVGILPSYAETYGYSMLEAMACGCAIVTTDISPMPEFVSDSCGWLVKVPKVKMGGIEYPNLYYGNSEQGFSEILTARLAALLDEMPDMRIDLKIKQRNAIEAVRQFHDPGANAKRLREIYKTCI